MSRFPKALAPLLVLGGAALLLAAGPAGAAERQFPARSGDTLVLDLESGATLSISGTGGSTITVDYTLSCTPQCDIEFDESSSGLKITTSFREHRGAQHGDVDLSIKLPERYDVELDSMGGAVTIEHLEGRFSGKTMGGELTLRDVRGTAELTTMGGEIKLTDSELDGQLKTMGGEVRFENVVGDVKGTSMGGNVRYKNVERRGGTLGSPARTGDIDESNGDTVQISTMGGEIEIDQAPEGADLHTMGGNIEVRDARRFVRAKTMGGDIEIDSVDGWVKATTMGGDVSVTVTGRGGDVTLTSMSGDITLHVPSGFGMRLDLEIAYTRNSRKEYRIQAPGGLAPTMTDDWDYGQGSPRKYIRMAGDVSGGGNAVKVRTINGDITIVEGR